MGEVGEVRWRALQAHELPAAGAPAANSASGVWLVEMDNAPRRNALTLAMWQQLRTAFEALQADASVRCIVLRGVGSAFCAGGDISEYPAFRFEPAGLAHFHEAVVWGSMQALLQCDVPIVAAIEGACMGAGVELACCCDVRWAAAGARFGAPIAKLGFPMAPHEMQLVAGQLGSHTARRMLLEAATFSAQELAAAGFLAPPVADGSAYAQALHSAQRIASLAPQAARMTKQTLRTLAAGQWPADPYAYADTAEHREGIGAFLAKRTPQF